MENVSTLYDLTKFFIAHTLLQNPRILVDTRHLEECFKEAENKIRRPFTPVILPRKVLSDIWIQLRLLYQAYLDAFSWFKLYKSRIPVLNNVTLNFTNHPQYNCTAFFKPTGFDDIKWVRKFVNDQQIPILDRFYFACFYCLELDIRSLWQIISCDERYPQFFKGIYKNLLREPPLVRFWVNYMEDWQNKVMEMQNEIPEMPVRRFALDSLKKAIVWGDARAASYIWNKLFPEVQNVFIANIDDYSSYIFEAIREDNFKIMDFFLEQIACQNLLSTAKFSSVLRFISQKFMALIVNPFDGNADVCDYEKRFNQVWCVGSQTRKSSVLQNELDILGNLICVKKYSCIELMLKDSTLEHKRTFLLSKFGARSFIHLLDVKDWSSFEKCVLLFLVDLEKEYSNPGLKPFHEYSLDLLKQFMQHSAFSKRIYYPNKFTYAPTILNNLCQEIEKSNLSKYMHAAAQI